MIVGVPVIRRYDLLWRFLKSLARATSPATMDVVVVDNGTRWDEQPWTQQASHVPAFPRVLRPGRNVGCSGAWNLLVDYARTACDPEVIIANDDIVLAKHSLEQIVAGFSQAQFVAAHGFSLFGIRVELVDEIGGFDENFFPAYFEDNDYGYRMKLRGKSFHVVSGGAVHTGSASLHCLSDAEQATFGVRFDTVLRAYYRKKWGGPPGEERFNSAFNGDPPAGWRLRPETG